LIFIKWQKSFYGNDSRTSLSSTTRIFACMSRSSVFCLRCGRQLHADPGELALDAVDLQFSTVVVYNAVADAQPQPGAFAFGFGGESGLH
jgi:hypothetical protein